MNQMAPNEQKGPIQETLHWHYGTMSKSTCCRQTHNETINIRSFSTCRFGLRSHCRLISSNRRTWSNWHTRVGHERHRHSICHWFCTQNSAKGTESVTLRVGLLLATLFCRGRNPIKLRLVWGIRYVKKTFGRHATLGSTSRVIRLLGCLTTFLCNARPCFGANICLM